MTQDKLLLLHWWQEYHKTHALLWTNHHKSFFNSVIKAEGVVSVPVDVASIFGEVDSVLEVVAILDVKSICIAEMKDVLFKANLLFKVTFDFYHFFDFHQFHFHHFHHFHHFQFERLTLSKNLPFIIFPIM
jgi:hypothetical protein